ncbi:MAG: chitobiase/beta-hexosaminidase C-terminal domain-containing protein [Verrucomicrobiae bacterium]|nr:chitobiase/beta-hexosaminidase C-terminal domain-containing protein [Verrucomicrobiae bacterium]
MDSTFAQETWAFREDPTGELYTVGGDSSFGLTIVSSLTFLQQKMLRLSPAGGNLNAGSDVKVSYGIVSDSSRDYLRRWQFHYTTDGSSPSPTSPVAELPHVFLFNPTIRIEGSQTLKVQAYRGEIPVTEVIEANFNIQTGVELMLPTFMRDSISIEVGMKALPADSTIRYTLDGSEPNEQSPIYSGRGTIRVEGEAMLRANAFHKDVPTGRSVAFTPGTRINPPRAKGWDKIWRSLLPGQPVVLVSDATESQVHFNFGRTVTVDSPIFVEPLYLEPGTPISMIAEQNGATSWTEDWTVNYRIREAASRERIGGAIREPAASQFEADALRMELLPERIAVMNNDVVFVNAFERGLYRIERGIATLLVSGTGIEDIAVSSDGIVALGSRLIDGRNGELLANVTVGGSSIDADTEGSFLHY